MRPATLSSLQLEIYGANMLPALLHMYKWNRRHAIDAISNEMTPAPNTEIEVPFVFTDTHLWVPPASHDYNGQHTAPLTLFKMEWRRRHANETGVPLHLTKELGEPRIPPLASHV